MTDPYEHLLGVRTPMFRAALEQELAALQATVDYDGRGAELPDGMRVGFDNLARVAAQCEDYAELRDVLHEHFRIMTSGRAQEELSPDETRAALRVRLVLEDSTLTLDGSLVREFAPGARAVLAIDLPETLYYPPSRAAINLDASVDELWQIGLDNTWRELAECDVTHQRHGGVHVLESESFCTTGIVYFLDRVMPGLLGVDFGESRALLFSVPDRHTVVLCPIDTMDEVMAAVRLAVPWTWERFEHEPGGVSPLTYVWDDHGIAPFASLEEHDGTARIVVQMPAHFDERFRSE